MKKISKKKILNWKIFLYKIWCVYLIVPLILATYGSKFNIAVGAALISNIYTANRVSQWRENSTNRVIRQQIIFPPKNNIRIATAYIDSCKSASNELTRTYWVFVLEHNILFECYFHIFYLTLYILFKLYTWIWSVMNVS